MKTQEEKRIKIAEACGWTHIRFTGGFIQPKRLSGCIPGDSQRLPLPDYFNDLNAMHEAEKVFTNAQWQAFLNRLEAVTGAKEHGTWWECIQCAVHATASQRAEAFGLTLGLWTA